MRIEGLTLVSYGAHADTRLELIEPERGLTVVLGPNEAGKSTTLRAIQALLFGIPRGTNDHVGRGRESIRVGARLRSHDGEAVELVRQGLNRRPLVDANGNVVDPAVLGRMLGGADQALFSNLFCIGHQELVENSKYLLDADGELGRLVFGATVGATALSRVQDELAARAEQIFKPGGSKPPMNQRLGERRDLLSRAREIQVRASDWGRRDDERHDVEAELGSVSADLRIARATASRLERIGRAIPRLLDVSAQREELARLEGLGPIPLVEVADSIEETLMAQAGAQRDLERETRRSEGLQARIATLIPSEKLLGAGGEIEQVAESIGRHRKDAGDLPALERDLHRMERETGDWLERLGAERDDNAFGRSVTDGQLAIVRDLAAQCAGLDLASRTARDERDGLETSAEAARRRLEALPVASNVEALRNAHRDALEWVALERGLATSRARVDALRTDASGAAARLGLGTIPLAEIEQIPVPLRSVIEDSRALHGHLERRLTELREGAEQLCSEREDLRRDTPAPDAAALATARERRDRRWRDVRTVLEGDIDTDGGTQPTDTDLPTAYEAAVAAADDIGDQRYSHAETLAVLERIDLELETRNEELRAAEADREALDQSWSEQWAGIGITPEAPAAMLEWRIDFDAVCAGLKTARQQEAELADRTAQVARTLAALRDALTAHDLAVDCGVRLDELARYASEVIDQADRAVHDRERAIEEVERLESDLAQRRRAVKSAEAGLDTWAEEWRRALAPLGLAGTTSLSEAQATCDGIDHLRTLREQHATLADRVSGLRREIEEYRERVRHLATDLAPEVAHRDALDAAREISDRFRAAQTAATQRETLVDQLRDADVAVEEAQARSRDAVGELRRLAADLELPETADLASVAERARLIDALRRDVANLEATLCEQEEGLPIDTLRAESDSYEGSVDIVHAELLEVSERIKELEDVAAGLRERRGELNERLRAVDGSSDAADLEQQAAEQLAEAAALGEDWVRLRLADAVLERVISEFSQHNQQPILEHAERAFTTMTSGAFAALEVDVRGGTQIVLAQRRNGELLEINQLSDGTRDQLYLALRIAGIHQHLDTMSEPLPVVLDDLLVNFDDRRAAAAVQVLAELGERTQVILFTHHPRDARVASETLRAAQWAVVELDERKPGAAPAPIPVAAPAAPGRSTSARPGTAADAILECLDLALTPLGRSAILSQTGVRESDWGPAVRSLIGDGRIMQEGQKRGAKYRVA